MFGAESISVLMTWPCSSIAAVAGDSALSSSESFSSCTTASVVTVEGGAVAGGSRRIEGATVAMSMGAGEAEDAVILKSRCEILDRCLVLGAWCCNVSSMCFECAAADVPGVVWRLKRRSQGLCTIEITFWFGCW